MDYNLIIYYKWNKMRKYSVRQSLKFKFILIVLLIILIAMSISSVYIVFIFTDKVKNEFKNSLKTQITAVNLMIENEIDAVRSTTQTIASENAISFAIEMDMHYQISEYGKYLHNKYDNSGQIFIFNKQRNIIFNSSDFFLETAEKLADRVIMNGNSVFYIDNIKELYFLSSSPVKNSVGEVIGAIVNITSFSKNSEFIFRIIDKFDVGLVLHYNGKTILFKNKDDIFETDIYSVENSSENELIYSNQSVNIGNKNYYLYLKKILNNNNELIGYFGTAKSSEELKKDIINIILIMSILTLLIIVFSILMIIPASNYLLSPLSDLIRILQKISKGDFTEKIKISIHDEIGVVASYLNETSDKLRIMIEQRDEINKKLIETDRLKDDFLANTSHELRTPLHGIVGITSSLIEGVAGDLSTEVVDNLKMVSNSGKRLLNLINDILDFEKMKHDDIELNLKPVSLYNVINIIISFIKISAEMKNVSLENKIPQNIPLILGDEDRMQQVFFNIIGNAVKFTQKGKVIVKSEISDDFITVLVKDEGIGIPEEKLSIIFDPFQQADGSISRKHGGTGLGLSISKKIIERHEGTISVESKINSGSTFYLKLPVYKSTDDIEFQNENSETIIEESYFNDDIKIESFSDNDDNKKNYHVLTVDDEPVNLKIIQNIFSMTDIHTDLSIDGYDALEKISKNPYDLIIIDVMMPNISGYELCRKIREHKSLSELPILMLTAKSRIEDVSTGFSAGANDYIIKPFEKEELLARVNTLVKLKKAGEQMMEQEQAILEEKLKSFNVFIAGIAHEINTPLGIGITTLSFLIDRTNILDNQEINDAHFIEEVRDSGQLVFNSLKKASDLITKLKKISINQSFFEKQRFEVKWFCRNEIDKLNDLLKTKNVRINLDCKDELYIFSYPDDISTILHNLVTNSILHGFKNMESGEINIDINHINDMISIVYSDNGEGIDDQIIGKIFDPFFTTMRGKGYSGLGLHIVYNLIVFHLHGSINCKVDNGTTFIIEFMSDKGE